MALLSRAMRTAAFTGNTDYISAWCHGRQLGPWAVQASAPVQRTPPADPAETLRQLTELHRRGVVTDAEFEKLRADLRV